MSADSKKIRRGAWLAGALALASLTLDTLPVYASSHREAPFITRHPKVDGTDFYMFRSYEPGRQDFVTLIANYVPLQDAYGGPNFFQLDPDALYEIHIDNNGDNREDLTFQFRFKQTLRDIQVNIGGKPVSIPLINAGAIDSINPATQNVAETYSMTLVRGDRRSGTRSTVTKANGGSATFEKPIDNIGTKSVPNYAAYANQHIHAINIPGCSTPGRVFVGQRKEGFGVNLGEIFDLINISPQRVTDPSGTSGRSVTDDKNITSIALELPIACVKAGDPVIGAWTTASLRQGRLINPKPGSNLTSSSVEGGPWAQVSRLSAPLVNEIVIGLKDKDKFNASHPRNDAQFADYVTNPTFPALVELLYGGAVKAPTAFPRADLVAAFLTGVTGVNKPASGNALSEMLRLNTDLPATPQGNQNYLGAAACFNQGVLAPSNPGCDVAGFPNGRRPGDDVVDIELRVAMGYLLPTSSAPSGQVPFTDGAKVQASDFDNAFPYLKAPIPGSPNGQNGVEPNP